MKGIYRFANSWGRMGELAGLFIADSDDVSRCIDKQYNFGEALGKHSEVIDRLNKDDIKLISDDAADVANFERLDLTIGQNPIENILQQMDEEQG